MSFFLPTQRALSDDEILRRAPSVFAEEAHESRSSRYAFIPTSEVLRGLRREGYEVYSVVQGRTRIPGKAEFTRHLLRLRHPDFATLDARVGDIRSEILLSNSHDGTSGYQLSAGLYRLVCANGMAVPESICEEVRVRHSGNVENDVLEGCIRVVGSMEEATKRVEEYRMQQLTPTQQQAFATAALALRWEEGAAPVSAERLLTPTPVRRPRGRSLDDFQQSPGSPYPRRHPRPYRFRETHHYAGRDFDRGRSAHKPQSVYPRRCAQGRGPVKPRKGEIPMARVVQTARAMGLMLGVLAYCLVDYFLEFTR